jgi:hypothetical protein
MYIEESVIGHIIALSTITATCYGYLWVKEKLTNKRKYERIAK